MKTYTVLN